MKYFWDFDPTAFSVFGLEVRWYGLAYLFAFFLATKITPKILEKSGEKISKKTFENLVFGAFFCGIIGGRIGHFLFFYPAVFVNDFAEIFKIWHGGMSIHGGILGATAFLFFFAKQKNLHFLKILDALVIPLSIGLFLGRIANFVNGELVGIPTASQNWGVVFPHIDALFRHPSQLYDAARNLVLVGVLYFLFRKNWIATRGKLTAAFLVLYGVSRFITEFWREPPEISPGQILCGIMFFLGVALFLKTKK